MRRTHFTFVLTAVTLAILLSLVRAQPKVVAFDPEIPIAAQTTIWQDYLEWVHPPKWHGDCEKIPVFKVTWMEPPGVNELQPVLWVKTSDKFGAILGLSYDELRYIEHYVWAQPVMDLRNVIILRPCRPPGDPEDPSTEE
jgi:hypothetical protein